jgi:hypothetical protein
VKTHRPRHLQAFESCNHVDGNAVVLLSTPYLRLPDWEIGRSSRACDWFHGRGKRRDNSTTTTRTASICSVIAESLQSLRCLWSDTAILLRSICGLLPPTLPVMAPTQVDIQPCHEHLLAYSGSRALQLLPARLWTFLPWTGYCWPLGVPMRRLGLDSRTFTELVLNLASTQPQFSI